MSDLSVLHHGNSAVIANALDLELCVPDFHRVCLFHHAFVIYCYTHYTHVIRTTQWIVIPIELVLLADIYIFIIY